MNQHNICRGFTIGVEEKKNKYMIVGLFFNKTKILEHWESVAQVSLITTRFNQKDLPKMYIYVIEKLTFEHVEREEVHYLKLTIGNEVLFLNSIEVQLFPSILNRIISRCDILNRNDNFDKNFDEFQEFKIFEDYPIQVSLKNEKSRKR